MIQFLKGPASNILYKDHGLKAILVCTLQKHSSVSNGWIWSFDVISTKLYT